MSSHHRHCPKHRRPLPCAHCAIGAKPAQAQLPATVICPAEPELNVEFLCPVCDTRFDGIQPELYDLVSCPQCSSELKVIKLKPIKLTALDNEAKDRDDAVKEVKQEKLHGYSRSDKKQPAYLQSVPPGFVPRRSWA